MRKHRKTQSEEAKREETNAALKALSPFRSGKPVSGYVIDVCGGEG